MYKQYKQSILNKMLLWAILIIVTLSSCSIVSPNQRPEQLAVNSGMKKTIFLANGFALTAYSRTTDKTQPINIYIEGDGVAWLSRYQLSRDPTPKIATGLQLALLDPAANVVYLARPCQFNDFNQTPCDSSYWSDKRFSEIVIDAMNQELDSVVNKEQRQRINLIGYSGGATVAVLLAARRHDIQSLRTIAGNLDHAYLNQHHRVNAMPESLNAIDVAYKIRNIPQLHFTGTRDKVVPSDIALRFIDKQGSSHCSATVKVAAGHQDGWAEQWQQLLKMSAPCYRSDLNFSASDKELPSSLQAR